MIHRTGKRVSYGVFTLFFLQAQVLRTAAWGRAWGTYFGGGLDEVGRAVCVDTIHRRVYVVGWTVSPDLPLRNPYQGAYNGGEADAFIACFSEEGQLFWSTYLGGDSLDVAYGCACDGARVYVVGATRSRGGIAGGDGFQLAYGGGESDGFVACIDTAGQLVWCSYYGGEGKDELRAVQVGVRGDLWVGGSTSSLQGVQYGMGGQPNYGGGDSDGWIMRLTPLGTPRWGRYIGGSGEDRISTLAVDSVRLYVGGYTASTDFPVSPNAVQSMYGGGLWDGFIAALDTSGAVEWASYMGGPDRDWVYGIARGEGDRIYLTGSTGSTSGITTPGSLQPFYSGGSCDGYLAAWDTAGRRLWSTYVGGDTNDWGYKCKVGEDRNIYLVGWTRSRTQIATVDAYQSQHGGGTYDAFIMVFTRDGQRVWGSYYGGEGVDWFLDVALGRDKEFYAVGYTGSFWGIASSGAYQDRLGGSIVLNYDAFLVKFGVGTAAGFETYQKPRWRVFPNPSFGKVWIEGTRGTFELWNAQGCCLRRFVVRSPAGEGHELPPETGVYFLHHVESGSSCRVVRMP
ncbi:MAG: hypothetical protein KatS3mg026_0643 [Bacteroidia bacterium]|nr:MAG: hypothetical protein KatS3mg026_0643 [Bacteroidia bacterium]